LAQGEIPPELIPQSAAASLGAMGKAAKSGAKKKLPTAPLGEKKQKAKKNPLFEKAPKNFRVGGDVQPKRDLTRFVRWPKYVRLQRAKRVLMMRLKVPPAINQFNCAVDKNQAAAVFRLMKKYIPETKEAKKARLLEMAQQKKDGTESKTKKPQVIKYGLNHITTLVENKVAKLVVIAHDVDPIELVCWLPALCRKKDVPYCIVKGKSRLGQLVHKKAASCIALTSVRQEDKAELDKLADNMKGLFNENTEMRRRWGGGIMGYKSQHVTHRREKAIALEQAKKLGLQIA
jgi:large subunit ribosomal protein L7Ae